MKCAATILFIMLFFSCESDSQNSIYISDDIKRLDKRIEFIEKKLLQAKELEPHSRRNMYVHGEAIWLNKVFDEIEIALLNAELITKHLKDIDRFLYMISFSMDVNSNTIDDLIKEDFDFHIEELSKLNITSSLFSDEEVVHSLKRIHVGILNTLFTLSRTDKYTFEKVEILPYDRNNSGFKAKEGDSVDVAIFSLAYDTTYLPQITYWIDDSTKNDSTGIGFQDWNSIKFGGDKGVHNVYGKYYLYPNNRKEYKEWQFTFEIE